MYTKLYNFDLSSKGAFCYKEVTSACVNKTNKNTNVQIKKAEGA